MLMPSVQFDPVTVLDVQGINIISVYLPVRDRRLSWPSVDIYVCVCVCVGLCDANTVSTV